ncbi:HET-domain-containing protein [Trichodelitschia bisporula]|uniref:HET-domain-containing protein n=1 Tax=Trichodelitschia bisporula TaxID=703511 RepID=A0A6G1I0F6_9PEZI|nr:HET-domain-containing protein [Trichodelitschia bisporula]
MSADAGGYLALSHCWGKPTDEQKKKFCTTANNLELRKVGFFESDLPKTFQHAVQVTRELGMKYLWIDALCIIQTITGADTEDWEKEAPRMEMVFGSAYCTLAASSAVDWEKGFLAPSSARYEESQSASGASRYSCYGLGPTDFLCHVDAAPLNQRAWVLQERVLSRRTLHFTGNCTYFECGVGVYCEDLTKHTNVRSYFLADPEFPLRLRVSGYSRSLDFLQYLFVKYAQSKITKESDRNMAIWSLMERMGSIFSTEHRYGIFKSFRFRLLLWRPGPGNDDGRHVVDNQELPSWSWMRYSRIRFSDTTSPVLHVPTDAAFAFSYKNPCVLFIRVRRLKDCTTEHEGRECSILDAKEEPVGFVWFDTMTRSNISLQECVVAGRAANDSEMIYILLVEVFSKNSYKRVGVGKIKARCISERYWNGELS